MTTFDAIFEEILTSIKALNARITNFETWEPSTGFVDTGAHSYLSSSQLINLGSYQQVTFGAELWDTDGIHSGGTMTIQEDGKYFFQTVLWSSGITGTATVRIYKSATETFFSDFEGTFQGVQLSGIMNCVVGDTIIVEVNPSVNMTILGSASNGYQSFFQVQRVG
jgi:hypothetical protein